MGVSRFFRWLSERWPCIFTTMTMETAPPTDNFFLNLNPVLQEAALHSGGHGDIPAILRHIESTIEKLVITIRPKQLIFITMDGVTPIAKLNQHRSKKFKIGENMKLAAAAATRRGEVLKSFDLNSITPGTAFMVDLTSHLKSLIRAKIKDDPCWPSKVIFSGCDVTGEADQKILDYLRSMKNSGHWRPNQRHCFYGLDAHTIMVSLVIHEPHCFLFKESSSRPKGSKGPAAREMLETHKQEDFISCSISLLRDYLEMELKIALPRSYKLDIERAIDDFVLFCVLSGNDFLPSLECLDGMDLLLENLIESYKAKLPSFGNGCYITNIGRIDGGRLQRVLEHCSKNEEIRITNQLRAISDGHGTVDGRQIHRDFLFTSNRAARDIFNASVTPEEAIEAWKQRHYTEKLQMESPSMTPKIVSSYFEGLNWMMRYFYRGLPSWTWYYPYHYAPMMSDLKNMDPAKVIFEMGASLSPLHHLMAVLPRASYKLVPRILQPLMTDPKSPLAPYYPNDCKVDIEGKRVEREAVVLLPFYNEQRLRLVVSKIPGSEFSREEVNRMRQGHSVIFTSDSGLIRIHLNEGVSCRDEQLKSQFKQLNELTLSSLKVFRSELPAGSAIDKNSPNGYWSLKSLNAQFHLEKIGVCLFSYPSDRASLKLTLPPPMTLSCLDSILGRLVYIDWPSLRIARVIQVETSQTITTSKSKGSDRNACFLERGTYACQETSISRQNCKEEDWVHRGQQISREILEKKGIDCGKVEVLLAVKPINGCLRCGLDQIQEKHGSVEICPLQAVLLENPYPHHVAELLEEHRLELSPHDRLLYVGDDHPGTVATVLEDKHRLSERTHVSNSNQSASPNSQTLQVSLQPQSLEILGALKEAQKLLRSNGEQYYPSGAVAARLGVTPQGLSRITGSLWVSTGIERHEVGLAVKLGSKNMCVVGFVRSSPNGTGWEYTEGLIRILESYRQSSNWVFEAVDATPEGGEINLTSVFPQFTEENLNGMVKRTKQWLGGLPLSGRPLISADAKVGSIRAIEEAIEIQKNCIMTTPKAFKTQLSKSMLVPPVDRSSIASREAGGEMLIGDLVAYIGSTVIGFGTLGIVIGVLSQEVEVLFPTGVLTSLSMFGDSTRNQSCLVPSIALVNISVLVGEPRVHVMHYSAANSIAQSHRSKSSLPYRNNNNNNVQFHAPSGNRRRWSGTPQWSHNEVIGNHPHPMIQVRPMMALGNYGSGVFIPGLPPMPGNLAGHPSPYMNYSMTPRY
eukprot:g8800.t1